MYGKANFRDFEKGGITMDKCNLDNLKKAVNDPEMIELFNKMDTPSAVICLLLLLDTDEQRQKDIEFIQKRVKEMLEERDDTE